MTLLRGLRVGVHVVEQREARRQCVQVGRDVVVEQRQLGVAVATRVVVMRSGELESN